ncbi:hypothetical protein ACFLRF_05255 [Candidatus Altiarchaeota archaeon]
MHKLIHFLIIVSSVSMLSIHSGCLDNPGGECTNATECEGKPHIYCPGSWGCREGICSWACSPGARRPTMTIKPTTTTVPPGGCASDDECSVGGCSSQICGPAESVGRLKTHCTILPEYDCLELTSCACIEGMCMWVMNDEYISCINSIYGGLADR